MSRFLHDDENYDNGKVIAIPQVFSENSRAKKVRAFKLKIKYAWVFFLPQILSTNINWLKIDFVIPLINLPHKDQLNLHLMHT